MQQLQLKLNEIKNNVQAQYQGSNIDEILRGFENVFNKYVVQATQSLYNHNLHLTTAKGAGLDCWGYLLHFSRFIPGLGGEIEPKGVNFWNFANKNFVNLQFYYKNPNNYLALEDYYFRRFLLLIYQGQFVLNNLPTLNNFMRELFEDLANITVKDSTNMEYIVYIFNTNETGRLPRWFTYVLDNYDILLRPAGVGSNWEETNYKYFGFRTEPKQSKLIRGNFYRTNFKK